MDYTAPITVWNTDNSTYTAYSVVDDALALLPLQAFFVQKPDAINGITFQPLGRQHTKTIQHGTESKSRIASASNRSIINLSLSNGICEDLTRVVVNPQADDAYDANCDAAKMLNLESTPQLYTLSDDGTMYAINEGEQLKGEVQMGMWFPQDGNYTLSSPRSDLSIEIYDNGELVTLPYTFSAFEGTDDARFMMFIKKGENTGINSISDSADKTAEMFDLIGRRISNVNQKGAYIINNRKVIK
jgi:WD40 repeat protein